jgi:hypothetical protein
MNWGCIFGARLMALSEVKIRKAKSLAKVYKLADEKGLHLLASQVPICCFLTAFAFLNMVIGIVVNVLEEEQQRELEADPEHVSIKQLHQAWVIIIVSLKCHKSMAWAGSTA